VVTALNVETSEEFQYSPWLDPESQDYTLFRTDFRTEHWGLVGFWTCPSSSIVNNTIDGCIIILSHCVVVGDHRRRSCTLKMEAAGSSEMLVTTCCVTMQCHIAEDGDHHNFCCWHVATSCINNHLVLDLRLSQQSLSSGI
jgi:hypothetical protein